MRKIVKQVVGIDVAQEELVVSFGRMLDDWTPEVVSSTSFANNQKGIAELQKWAGKLADPSVSLRYVMEATGVYHEDLAYNLNEAGCQITIVLPNKISNYIRSLNLKTITDKTAAQAILYFGLEKKLDDWKCPDEATRRLRQLTRERDQIIESRTQVKNQLHAMKASAYPLQSSIKRLSSQINLLNKQEAEVTREIEALIQQNEKLKASVNLLTSIPGIGKITAAVILGETHCFDLIRNRRQLTSYAGLDIREKQSGTSVRAKPRISKKGNKHLRKAMYFPAFTAIRHDERFKAIYARLVVRQAVKMKSAVAIQRKLLELTFTVYKTGQPYEKNYLQNHQPLEATT